MIWVDYDLSTANTRLTSKTVAMNRIIVNHFSEIEQEVMRHLKHFKE